jgi:tetratricopeptide (TPR) repeat protein
MATLDYLITNETPIPFVVENYSRILLEKGDTLGAKEVIKKALVKSNYNNDIFNVLVNYYLAIDRQDQLMAEVDGQIAEVPNSKNYWIRGYLNERAGNYVKATADYQKARELDEFSFDANWNLGVALMKYETKDLIDQISKTNDAVEKAKLESKKNETFKTARSYLEFASENINYSKDELINISNAIRTCCLEIGDEKCTSEQRDRVRTLNGFEFKIGDKFTYRITGDATKMQISYQNARNTNSTIYDQNGNWEKEFDCVDKTDLLSLSVTIKGDGEATLYIIVNGVPVDEKTISGNGARGYLRF